MEIQVNKPSFVKYSKPNYCSKIDAQNVLGVALVSSRPKSQALRVAMLHRAG